MPTVSEAILEQLRLWGVKRIYGVVGDAIFGWMDAIAKQNEIRFISVKHESVAAMMASAEAKCTGKLGVCAAQMGPGLANLLNGLGDAYLDGCPVLAITGQAPLSQIGTSYKQFINQQELVRALTGYTQLVVHPEAVMPALSTAIQTSMAMETVSHLTLPADLFTMPIRSRPYEPIVPSGGVPCRERVQQALGIMRQAKRPMMLIGNQARPAAAEMMRLAEIWGCGIAFAYGAKGVVPDDFPFGLGGLGEGGNPYLPGRFREADAVLAIGTSWWPESDTPSEARVIRIVRHEQELGIGIPAECGLVGDIRKILDQLAIPMQRERSDPAWVLQIEQCKRTWEDQNEAEGKVPGFPLHPSRIVRAIEKRVSPDAIIALDEGDSTLWFLRNFRAKHQHVLLSGRWRTMGFGLPAAMASKFCYPDRQVLCLTGDGGLGMVMADLLTAARYRLPIAVIVFRNDTLQMERNKMEKKGLRPEGTDIVNPDYVKLAESCGWDGLRVQSPEKLEEALQTSLTSVRPVLLDVPAAQAVYPGYPKTN
ncbi:thiamine pyrophosphate-binding protein [Cohnella sp. CFH 77786]|uniref:thiamine pyrophosphate-binding protein n=1 Tax=Cohnella sp. CFH 77786 TaxID=2662265 RepID=UPI001C608ECA|nr:thiamine pyrophosphate-binding protein [Cohnella sp. CFH 77786]MBW5446434.1 thiamine pyrophosphate-binding protein [Cohnella sp. CFH 77786]